MSSEDPAALRDRMIDQLALLTDEVEAMRSFTDRIPEKLLVERPTESEPAIVEIYGLIAHLDTRVRRPVAELLVGDDRPRIRMKNDLTIANEQSWRTVTFADMLQRVHTARNELVEPLRACPVEAWTSSLEVDGEEQTGFEWIRDVLHADTGRLRTVAQRLHNAHLSDREEDLPK